jgi:hypothetical protein
LRGALLAALGAAALLVPAASAAAANGPALLEPVAITATAPQSAVVGSPFQLAVAVEAEPDALGIAAAPIRVRVKLALECGGSFVGTAGPTAFEATLPTPIPAGPYSQTFSGQVTVSTTGTETVCAFLEDAQERQFATDTEAQVSVFASPTAVRQCPAATQRLVVIKRNLRPMQKRIAKTKRKLHKSHGKERKKLSRKLHGLQKKKRKLAKQRRAVAETVQEACP